MDRSKFATLLRNAILGVWKEFIADRATHSPYAFALIGGQRSSYLSAVARADLETMVRSSRRWLHVWGRSQRFSSHCDSGKFVPSCK
ncbi:MAG: hypothetical protein MUE44_13565 [Oscillatoriaceae cyanobacterium Prado104]|jgi:hypothetical protein|nr:hypothetical protein [Oscillatoriaceae cyanobacterium Prado104]